MIRYKISVPLYSKLRDKITQNEISLVNYWKIVNPAVMYDNAISEFKFNKINKEHWF